MIPADPDIRDIQVRQILPLFFLAVPIIALLYALAPQPRETLIEQEGARETGDGAERRNNDAFFLNGSGIEQPVASADQQQSEREKTALERRSVIAAEKQAEAAETQTTLGIIGFFIAMAVLIYTDLSFRATEKSNITIARLNKQWIDTCQWRCQPLFRIKFLADRSMSLEEKERSGMIVSFRVKNSSNHRLTLNRALVHVSLDGELQSWEFTEIDAPLAPRDRYRLSVDVDLTTKMGKLAATHGFNARVIGCAYFTDTFGESDSTLFGRILWESDGKTFSESHNTALARRWKQIEERNPTYQTKPRKKQGQPKANS